jgi:iron complex transport system ATP-binding protein
MRLAVDGVTVKLGGREIVGGTDLTVEPGEFVGLVGPNGSGKSTLLRTIYRALRPDAGLISLDGDDLWRLPSKEAARRVAVLAQDSPTDVDFTVAEVVALGRTPHKRPLDRDTAEDRTICAEALEQVGLAGFDHRLYTTLSGGEKQRVLLARALAQRSHLHLLDEPTNHLDVRYQLEILSLVRRLGHATLAAIHDLNLAAAYCDRIYLMAGGRLVADGPPGEILTGERIADVFGVHAHRWTHPRTGRPILAFDHLDESR